MRMMLANLKKSMSLVPHHLQGTHCSHHQEGQYAVRRHANEVEVKAGQELVPLVGGCSAGSLTEQQSLDGFGRRLHSILRTLSVRRTWATLPISTAMVRPCGAPPSPVEDRLECQHSVAQDFATPVAGAAIVVNIDRVHLHTLQVLTHTRGVLGRTRKRRLVRDVQVVLHSLRHCMQQPDPMAILGKEAGGCIHPVQQITPCVVHHSHCDEMMGMVLAMQHLENGLLVDGAAILQHLGARMELVVPACAVNLVEDTTQRSNGKQLLRSRWQCTGSTKQGVLVSLPLEKGNGQQCNTRRRFTT
jgi:hypothetical protein